MKTKLALIFLLAVCAAAAQIGHNVTATWTDTVNPSGTAYNMYRATGVCSATAAFSKIGTGLTAKTYTDSGVAPGNYCYQVTALFLSIESGPSNQAGAAIGPIAPTGLSLTIAMLVPGWNVLDGGFLTQFELDKPVDAA